MASSTPILGVRMTNYYAVRDSLMRANRMYRGAFRDTIKHMLNVMRNYSSFITHRETGTLARSHRVYYDGHRMSGYVYPSELYSKVRYRGKVQYANEYAAYEHARGGGHAFYSRALQEMGPEVAQQGIHTWIGSMNLRRSIG